MKRETKLPERNLDVLRAIAVLGVLLAHLVKTRIGQNKQWSELGRAGVLLFFVHTSLVLMSSLERLIEREGLSGRKWVSIFYFRRAARIYPLAWATIALCVLGSIPSTTIVSDQLSMSTIHTPFGIFANVLLAQNLLGKPHVLGVLWTLPIEVQMYLLLPICFLFARRSSWWPLIGAIGLGIVAGEFVQHSPFRGLWRFDVATYACCFLAGATAYRLLRTLKPDRERLPSWTWVAYLGVVLSLAIRFFRDPREGPEDWWMFCFAVGLMIPFAAELPKNWLTKTGQTIAKYSYGIYLLHMPCYTMGFDWTGSAPEWVKWTTYFALLIGLPVLAYHLIEHPAIQWAKRRTTQRAVAVEAAPAFIPPSPEAAATAVSLSR